MTESVKNEKKAERERQVFVRFAVTMGWPTTVGLVESRNPDEPDILYHRATGAVAFELAEICYRPIAHFVGKKTSELVTAGSFYGEVDLTSLLIGKCSKPYKTEFPIELLLYDDGRTTKLDDVGIQEVRDALVAAAIVPFRRVWYWGVDDSKSQPVAIEM